MGVIYARPNLINGKKYVGQAKDLKTRQKAWKCLSQPYSGDVINRAREKYGIDNFGFEILKECDDEELNYWEMYYIKELNTKVPYGYNLTDGGDGMSGYHFTEETRKKISEANKGKNKGKTPWNKGKHRSEETKRKISEAHKGDKNGMYGKHLSEEHKNNLSKALTNRSDQSKPVLQIDKNTNEVVAEFPSIHEVKRQLNYNSGHIASCCNGKKKSYGGFIWRYK